MVACFFKSPAPEYYEESNVLLGSEYLSVASQKDLVIVGSSMGAKIKVDALPGAFNLSFTGRGALDGLAIVKHSSSRPSVVLVEVNTLFRSQHNEFTDKITSPYGRFLNRGSHEMPVNYIVEISAWAKCKLTSAKPDSVVPQLPSSIHKSPADLQIGGGTEEQARPDKDAEIDTMKNERAAFAKVTAQNIAEWQTLPEFYHLDENLDLLADYAATFAAENINLILMELPCNAEIYNSPRFQAIHEGIRSREGLRKLPLIRVDDISHYQSNDGLHLIPESSRRFTEFIATEVSRILKKP